MDDVTKRRLSYPRVSDIIFKQTSSQIKTIPIEKLTNASLRGIHVHQYCTTYLEKLFMPEIEAEYLPYADYSQICIGGCYVEGELQETMLKQSVDGVDVPKMDEIQVEVKENAELIFEIPEDISKESVERFLNDSASTSGKSKDDLIRRANQRPQAFIDALRAWEDKNRNNESYEEAENIEISA